MPMTFVMAARRLVLNGLTAEVRAPTVDAPLDADNDGSPDSMEFYHELELYRQLLALPAATAVVKEEPPSVTAVAKQQPPSAPATPASAPILGLPRRARTPDPTPPRASQDVVRKERRSRTPAPRATLPSRLPPAAQVRNARYLGSFPAEGATSAEHAAAETATDNASEADANRTHHLSDQLHQLKESGQAVPVLVVIALSGVKVCDPDDQSVRMSHALRRISYATCEAARALFAFVAREPRQSHAVAAPAAPATAATNGTPDVRQYCHAFETDTPDQAEELNTLLGNAFRMAFASQLQPSAPIWGKDLSGSDCGMGVSAPDSLPGLARHYPHCLSPAKCNIMGVSRLVNEPSPSSSEESSSPTELTSYRRLGDRLASGGGGGRNGEERAPLIKRLALGFSGALLQPSDDDSTPLVVDTPTTPTNIPLCLNGGYINEASEAEQRTRESNREPPAPPRRLITTDNITDNTANLVSTDSLDVDFRKCNNIKNCSPAGPCSRTTSSSSGASSSGASHCSPNNNPRIEPELKQAPWFQQGIPREIALEVLSSQPVGAFLVRGSTTQPACYALSVRVPRDFQPSGIAHYLILRTPKGYKIKGFTKEFTSLSALVTHHSVMPELLPVPLRLPRPPHRTPAPSRRDHADIDALSPHSTPHHTPRHTPRHTPHHTSHHSTPHHIHNFLTQLDV